jgi:DNA-binding transcriptional ArsR family regulator
VSDVDMVQELKSHAVEAAQLLKALANENRLMILCSLAQGEMNVTELNDRVALSQSALSQHLAWLRRENLVQTRRDAQTIFYSLQGSKAQEVIQVLQSIYCADMPTSN